MNFTQSQLRPSQTGFTAAKSVSYHMPHTPFWNPLATLVDQKTRGFHGDDFFLQNKSTNEYEQDLPSNPFDGRFVSDAPICGFAAYSLSTSVDYRASPFRNGTREIVYVFNEAGNAVTLTTIAVGGHAIGTTNTRTVTTRISGDQYNSPPDHAIVTLSGTVDKSSLGAYLDTWRSKSETFRDITGTGLGTYSYIGQGATKSESDGYLAEVGGGDVRALPYTFTLYSASGMTGDSAALWNGNFSAYVHLVTRKNSPVLHRETSSANGFAKDMDVGSGIYRAGYSEIELSEPLTSWRDDYGVFETVEALEYAPLFTTPAYSLEDAAGYTGEGDAHEIYLTSRDGRQYRITFAFGEYSWNPSTGETEWVTGSTQAVTTDTVTLRTPAFTYLNPGGYYYARVAKIEVMLDGDWVIVQDIANGDDPETLVGYSVRQEGKLLFAVVKVRRGVRWGFTPLNFVGTARYRVMSSQTHRNPGTITVPSGSCGGSLTGSYDAEWTEEYSPITGLLQPRNVTQWQAVINGIDWTPPEAPTSVSFSSTMVVNTATRRRWEQSHTRTGRFVVAMDAPAADGQIVATSVSVAGVTFTGGVNLGNEVALLPPASGQSVFCEGFRLRQ